MLRQKLERGNDVVLADYFDFVAGISIIIAACISLGMKVSDIRTFYIGSEDLSVDREYHHNNPLRRG